MSSNMRNLPDIGHDDVILAIRKACERRQAKLVKKGMDGRQADRRVLKELEGVLLMNMGRFVFPHEMSSECKLDDLDEDGDPT